MFVSDSTNGKIKGIKFCINNIMRLFLSNDDVIDIQLDNTTKDDFFKKMRKIDENISDDFVEKIYNFSNGRKE